MTNQKDNLCLVGHPLAPIGMGEHVRSTFKAFKHAGVNPSIVDIYNLSPQSRNEFLDFSSALTNKLGKINIFNINGDEVKQSLSHLSLIEPWSDYNIIYPAWELANYPKEWADQLDRFDEIWAPSSFIHESLKSICKKPIFHMPLACEVSLTQFLSRRYFRIPETHYTFLFFFDVRSYINRKNPYAVIDAFRLLLDNNKYAKITLVLKINSGKQAPDVVKRLNNYVHDIKDHIIFFNTEMNDNEVKNLIRCCDCFISLHRSEGFGRGMSEAMFLGKPVIATGYSGNMDFMNQDVAFIVNYKLIPVAKDEYPHYQNQVWAEPDIHEAAGYMKNLVENPKLGRDMGKRGLIHIRTNFSYKEVGMRYKTRINEIL